MWEPTQVPRRQQQHETDIDDIFNRAFLEGAHQQVLEARFEPVSNRGIKAALLPGELSNAVECQPGSALGCISLGSLSI
jgi:hypothetical protein